MAAESPLGRVRPFRSPPLAAAAARAHAVQGACAAHTFPMRSTSRAFHAATLRWNAGLSVSSSRSSHAAQLGWFANCEVGSFVKRTRLLPANDVFSSLPSNALALSLVILAGLSTPEPTTPLKRAQSSLFESFLLHWTR